MYAFLSICVSMVLLAVICEPSIAVDRIVEGVIQAHDLANTHVESLQYEASCSGRTAATPHDLNRQWRLKVAVAGANRSVKIFHHREGLPLRLDPNRCRSILTADGLEEFWINRRVYSRFDSIPESRISSVNRMRIEFLFECTGLWPHSCRAVDEINVSSIEKILEEGNWAFSEYDLLGERLVLIRNDSHVLYLSRAMGFAIVRRISRLKDTESLFAIYENRDFQMYGKNLWLPSVLQRTIARGQSISHFEPFSDIAIEDVWSRVTQQLDGIRINAVDGDHFSTELPAGTICVEPGSATQRTLPGGTDMLDDIALVALASAMEAKPKAGNSTIDFRFLTMWTCVGIVFAMAINTQIRYRGA